MEIDRHLPHRLRAVDQRDRTALARELAQPLDRQHDAEQRGEMAGHHHARARPHRRRECIDDLVGIVADRQQIDLLHHHAASLGLQLPRPDAAGCCWFDGTISSPDFSSTPCAAKFIPIVAVCVSAISSGEALTGEAAQESATCGHA